MPEHEVRSHLRYRRTIEHNMPTGTKIATIVLVVLLGAAGLYYAFVAPPASNTKSTAAKESGTATSTTTPSGPSTLTLTPPTGTSPTTTGVAPLTGTSPMPATGTAANTPRGTQPTFTPGTLGTAGTGKGDTTTGALPNNGLATGGGNTTRPAPTGSNGFTNGFPSNTNPLASNTTATGSTTTGGPTPTGFGTTTGGTNSFGTGGTTGGTSPTGNTGSSGTISTTAGERTHVIASGDTFSKLAAKYYGDANKWSVIAKANPLVSADRLKVGAKIRIPEAGSTTVASKSTAPSLGTANTSTGTASAGSTSGDTHVVAAGDTLSSLSRKYYGSTKYWEKLYSANKSTIGSNPANLKVGSKLTVPARTTVVSGENVGG